MLMVGWFMRKAQGIFSYKGSKTRTPLVINPNPTRTSHVNRPFNLYKEGQGTPRRTSNKIIAKARHN